MFPPLRQELSIHFGPSQSDGSPTWLIYDPSRALYFQIGWPLFEIIQRWEQLDTEQIIPSLNEQTTLRLTNLDLQSAVQFLHINELLQPTSLRDTKLLLARNEASKHSALQWLIHNYLFFRIPLFQPDRFLTATLPWIRFLAGRFFAVVSAVVLVTGLVLVSRQWNVFIAQLASTLTFEGLFGYVIALAFAKTIHELGHAYVAKSYGCRVSTMGLAFLVLYPVLYTDTNDAWKIRSRRGRLAIASAGILAELYLAAWATFLWSFMPLGTVKSMAITLAATTWISSLAVNISPLMRFDGYYILSDFWGIPNLHARAFAFGRWFMRELLFDLREPAPEPVPQRRRAALVTFAYIVWVCRLVVFLGIAVLVYHFFIKILGIAMFLVEIIWFVALPVGREMLQWWNKRQQILRGSRIIIATLALLLGIGLAAFPWYGLVEAPGLLRAERVTQLYPKTSATVVRISVFEGQFKKAGELLFSLRSDELDYQLANSERRIALIERELQMASFDQEFRAQSQFLRAKLISAQVERQGLTQQRQKLEIVAPFTGQVFDILPDLRVGQPLSNKQKIASLRDPDRFAAIGFVTEDQVFRLAIGQEATFYPDALSRAAVRGRVLEIELYAIRTLEYPVLSTSFGGPIATNINKDKDKRLQPQESLYKVTMQPVGAVMTHDLELSGKLKISAQPESLLGRAARAALAVLVRESGM